MRKVGKFPLIGINQDLSDASLPPGYCREITNMIPAKGGYAKSSLQNVPGTIERANASLAAGTNTILGSHEDVENNRIYYFWHNSNNNHSIWYFDPNANTHTKVLQETGLNFTSTEKITGIKAFGDFLYWADSNGPRWLIVSKAVAGTYYSTGDALKKQLSQYRVRPQIPPTLTRNYDSSYTSNNIDSDGFQFAYRFVFHDDSVSLFSPLSKLSVPEAFPKSSSTASNRIIVTPNQLDSDLDGLIKKLQFATVKNSSGDYFIIKEVDYTQGITTGASYQFAFYNDVPFIPVPESETAQTNEVPLTSKNFTIVGQRGITTMDTFDYADTGSFTFSVGATTNGLNENEKISVPGTSTTLGVVFFDDYGRTNGVLSPKVAKLNTHTQSIGGSYPIQTSTQCRITWSISGTAPSWASKCSIVAKPNNNIQSVITFATIPLFYLREGDTPSGGEIADDGKIYQSTPPSSWTKDLTFIVPDNLPISISDGYMVRMITSMGQSRPVEQIKTVAGNKITCGNFGITNWSSIGNFYLIVQLEKQKTEQDELYYEIGSVLAVSGGSVSSADTWGGEFYLSRTSYKYSPFDSGSLSYGSGFTNLAFDGDFSQNVISQSPTNLSTTITTDTTSIEKVKIPKGSALAVQALTFGAVKAKNTKEVAVNETTVESAQRVYTLDYSKIMNDFGRPWIEVTNKRENSEPTTLAISNKYIQNTKVNGLAFFQAKYELPRERTPIRKLQPVGENIFLAIHERTTSTLIMSSGSGVVKTSDGSEITVDGDAIIGYDRELTGGYGTIYPESVVEHEGRVWFFDPYKGELIRYAANGLTPLAQVYGMRNWFVTKGKTYINTTNRNVYGGYDPNLDMVIMTFRSSNASEEATIGFIDRPGEERFIGFYSFKPDLYSKINNKLFAFKSGSSAKLYEHGVSATYNNFYGTQYNSSIKKLFNSEFSREKILRSISTESSTAWAFPSIYVYKNGTSDQETSLTASSFRRREDIYYADVRRDKNTNFNFLGDPVTTNTNAMQNRQYTGVDGIWFNDSPTVASLGYGDEDSLLKTDNILYYNTTPSTIYRNWQKMYWIKPVGNIMPSVTFNIRLSGAFNLTYTEYIRITHVFEIVDSGLSVIATGSYQTHYQVVNGEVTIASTNAADLSGNPAFYGVYRMGVQIQLEGGIGTTSGITCEILSVSSGTESTYQPVVTYKSGRNAGKMLKGKFYEINMQNTDTSESVLDYVNYGYIDSPGHRVV